MREYRFSPKLSCEIVGDGSILWVAHDENLDVTATGLGPAAALANLAEHVREFLGFPLSPSRCVS